LIAYVLVKVEPGKESGVAREIVKAREVKEAAWTYGFCDILLKAEAPSINELDKIVFNKIRRTPGVVSTETIIVSPIPIYASRPPRRPEATRARLRRRTRAKR